MQAAPPNSSSEQPKIAPWIARPRRYLAALFAMLMSATIFEGYDITIFHLATPEIARTFHLADPAIGLMATIVRFGGMLSFLVVILADRYGRKPIITTTGNKDIIKAQGMARMKHQAVVGNIGHFDNEIDIAGLARTPGIERVNIKPQVDKWVFPDGHAIIMLSEGRLLNLGNATGHPSFVMSNSFSNQTIAQIELFTKNHEYEKKVYVLPKHLYEKVARLHLAALGVKLT